MFSLAFGSHPFSVHRMELRCVIAVIRHGDRTPKQKMKMEVKHPRYVMTIASLSVIYRR